MLCAMLSFYATSFSETINVKHESLHNGDDDSTFLFFSFHSRVRNGWEEKRKISRIPRRINCQVFFGFILSKFNRRLGDFHFCAIFFLSIYFSCCCIKKHFIFLKNRFPFAEEKKWKIWISREFCVFFIDFLLWDSQKLFSVSMHNRCLISSPLLLSREISFFSVNFVCLSTLARPSYGFFLNF